MLRLFVLIFGRDAFLPGVTDARTFHERAIEEGAYYEQRVAASLAELVFDRVFPDLARAVAAAAPDAPLPDVRDAALTLLYRLLFILYAEDRELLPVRDARYDDYSLRERVRDGVRRRKDEGDAFSAHATSYWRFFNWQPAFPGVWTDWDVAAWQGGFDAVIGNPPWDRMKLQQVEWFAVRRPQIARQPRAADRRRMVAALEETGDPLAHEYRHAAARAETAARVARRGGTYPLLSRGDVNLYSLFVERALSLIRPDGLVGLVVPSGIAADKTAARFFRSVATEGRLQTLYDFENRRVFFPDQHASFKFCAFVAGRTPATTCLVDVSDSRRAGPSRLGALSLARSVPCLHEHAGSGTPGRDAGRLSVGSGIVDTRPGIPGDSARGQQHFAARQGTEHRVVEGLARAVR